MGNLPLYIFIIILVILCICLLLRQTRKDEDYRELNLKTYGTTEPWKADIPQTIWPEPDTLTKGNSILLLPGIKFHCQRSNKSLIWLAIERFHDTVNLRGEGKIHAKISIRDHNEDLQFGVDESYTLDIDRDGILITSNTVFGAIHALTSLTQLIQKEQGKQYILSCPWKITDKPRFGWRGLLIDTSRHFLPMYHICKILDGMSYVKMNVLHWHAIDSQAFSLNLLQFGDQLAGYSEDEMYSRSDVEYITNYAWVRGIRVVMEVEVPGHASIVWNILADDSVLCPPTEAYSSPPFAWEPPPGQLDPTNDDTIVAVENVIKEVCRWMPDNYIHLGGDELSAQCWGGKKDTDISYLVQDFERKIHKTAEDSGKLVVNWEDVVSSYNAELDKERTVLSVWKSSPTVLLDKGYKILDCNYNEWYLDCGIANPVAFVSSWCDPFKNWYMMYNHDPYYTNTYENGAVKDTVQIDRKYWGNILGGEASLWGELVDYSNVEQMLWPRLSAVAERLWSRMDVAGGISKYTAGKILAGVDASVPKSPVFEVLNRLRNLRLQLIYRKGISAVPLQTRWCDQNPELCNSFCVINCPCQAVWCPTDSGSQIVGQAVGPNEKISCSCSI